MSLGHFHHLGDIMSAYRLLAALIGWGALALQYWLMMNADAPTDPVNRTINFFSYFTILTNILVALAMTAPLLAPNSRIGRFFDKPGVRTAIATYIIVVSVTYHLLLRDLWDPQGLQKIADYTLHYGTPALFVLDWLLFVPKRDVPWSAAFKALGYPIVYLAWTLYHGTWSGFYPYPFVDVGQLGMEKVLINSGAMTAAFIVLCLVLIALGKILSRLVGDRTQAA